ncbi:thermonuclease family protein [Anaerolineales bacterium HSG25]|nr:thermonuclease family protein [Anaerolineales bacterium HSG25]
MSYIRYILCISSLLLFLSACGEVATPNRPMAPLVDALPTINLNAVPTPTSTLVLSQVTPTTTPTVTPIPDEVKGFVVDVLDGDTIAVVMEGDSFQQAYIVRYIGVDAPEKTAKTPWGQVAYEQNRDYLQLKAVRLVRDQTDFDEEGNLLRYVYLGEELVNVWLVENGLAEAISSEPNVMFRPEIGAGERLAQESGLGLWGPDPTATPKWIRPTANPETADIAPTPEDSSPDSTAEPSTNDITATVTTSLPSSGLNIATSTPRLTSTTTIDQATVEPTASADE